MENSRGGLMSPESSDDLERQHRRPLSTCREGYGAHQNLCSNGLVILTKCVPEYRGLMDTPDPESGSRSSSPPGRPPQGLSHTRTSCDLCKRLKIKCERQGESCLHCIDRGATCVTTLVERKKRQPNRTSSLLDIESRIKRMESVITASGLSAHWDAGGDSPSRLSDPHLADPGTITDRLSTLIISDEGKSRFLGASSGFSLFSPQGLQWISEKTGNNDLAQFISKLSSHMYNHTPKSTSDLYHSLPASEREPVPPKQVADVYVQFFFDSYNSIFPLFDRESFDEKYELQYSGTPPTGPGWYAAFNIVLCVGCLLLQIRSQDPSMTGDSHEALVWNRYLRNASSCFLELLFQDGTLLAIQAIVSMAIVQQISLQPQSVYILTAAASRLAYSIGLHRNLKDFGLSQAEIKERKNVFWIVYLLDKSVALRLGHPSMMNDDDIGIGLPDEDGIQIQRYDGSLTYGIFRYQVQLARLESRIHSDLYSARAQNRPALDRLRTVGELDKALLEWRDALPEDIQPEKSIKYHEDHILPIVMMHFAYFNCLTTIHRVSIHHGSWTSSHLSQSKDAPHDQNLNPRVYASQSICLAAARQSIELLRQVELKTYSTKSTVIWMLLYYPLSGLLTLFANSLQNPQDPQVASDVKLMESVISFFSKPVIHMSPITSTAARIFEELVAISKKLVEKTTDNLHKPAKRTRDESDSQQDNSQDLLPSSSPTQPFLDPDMNVDLSGPTLQSIETPYHDGNVAATDFNEPLLNRDMNNPQYNLQPQPPYTGDMLPNSGSSMYPSSSMPPTDPSIVPVVSEYFEWDLANLWNFDIGQTQERM